MATASELSQIQGAINALRGGSAYETPFSEDIALRLAPVAQSTGFMSAGAFLEAVKNNPLSTLLSWAAQLNGSGGSGGSGGGETPAIVTTPGNLSGALGTFSYGPIPGLTKLVFNTTVSIAGYDIEGGNSTLTAVEFPNLESIDPNNTQAGYFTMYELNVTSLSFPKLTFIAGGLDPGQSGITTLSAPLLASCSGINVDSCPLVTLSLPSLTQTTGAGATKRIHGIACLALQSVILPELVTITTNTLVQFEFWNSPLLTTLSVPKWVPTDGKNITLSGCALSAASVEGLLRRCVLAGMTAGAIDVSGGTNAGLASLNAQGQADAATLGALLTINP
jgi:hypothetical protein